MNRRVIPVECGGCWAEAVGVRPAQDRPVQDRAWIPSGCDWPLLSLGVASLGHCSLHRWVDLSFLADSVRRRVLDFLAFLEF